MYFVSLPEPLGKYMKMYDSNENVTRERRAGKEEKEWKSGK